MSDIIIIDKTKRAPIYVHKDKPTFRTEKERDRYFDKEMKYWLEGKDHLPGPYYHYLSQQWLKNRITGQIFRPLPRYSDLLIHERIQHNRDMKRHMGAIKARGVGFSSIGGGLCNYFAITYPGSNSLVTSKESGSIKQFFLDKIYNPFSYYDTDLVGEPMKANAKNYHGDQPIYEVAKNMTKSECYFRVRVHHADSSGTPRVSESQVITRETASSEDKATSFSSLGGLFGFYDELPLHRRKAELLRSSVECYRDPATKELTGFLLWGGTCEDALTDAELGEFQKLVKSSELDDTDIMFIPYWMTMFLDDYGYPDEERAKRWHDAEMKKKENDEGALKAFLKNNPRSLDDIFTLANAGKLESDVLAGVKRQRELVIEENIPLRPVEISKVSGRIEAKVQKESPIRILEDPKPGVSYATVVDSMALGTEAGSHEGSDYCAVVIKMYDPSGDSFSPVAYYKERPNKVDSAYWQTVMLSEYYEQGGGKFEGIMAEASNSTEEWMTNMLINNGYHRYIMYRKDLSGKGYINTNKSFQPVNNWTMDFQWRQANTFLRKHVGSIKLLPLLEELLLPADENADMRSAWLMFFCAFPDINKEVTHSDAKPIRKSIVITDSSGKRVRKVIVENSGKAQMRVTQSLKFTPHG